MMTSTTSPNYFLRIFHAEEMQYLYHSDSPRKLLQSDFIYFSESFSKALAEFIPFFENVVFLHNEADADRYLYSAEAQGRSRRFWREKDNDSGFICCYKNQILFTVPAQMKTLAVISGVDSYFVSHVSADWLEGFHRDVINRFMSIVSAGIDIETGLLNGGRFIADLGKYRDSSKVTILLIELYPRARSSRESALHTAKSAHTLRGTIPVTAPLYSLRHHVYAVTLHNTSRKTAHTLARKILSRLRTEGFPKVHIGMRCEIHTTNTTHRHPGREIFEQVGQALDTARKRGPYALCDYEHVLYPEKHPLRRPSQRVMARFRKVFSHQDRFCVVLFSAREPIQPAPLQRLRGDAVILEDGEDVYVFLADMDAGQARKWATDKIAEFNGADLRAGIASYPYAHFGKSQTLFNSRKALRHADFYGPGGLAVFNALSLNISGDIYYEEGDLTSAVREYKEGLLCNSEETNLLNSLGVCYVDMGRHSLARRCFDEVLRLDGDNFMALVNAGLESLRQGNHSEAIDSFEKALAHEKQSREIKDDIAFQLGKLYCLTGKYDQALAALHSLSRGSEHTFLQEKAFAYLGKSYYGMGKYDLAAKCLQKALHSDEFDAETMGLLGYIYLLRGEGRDIAFSLCAKSVELAPDNGRLRLYLAEVKISCGQYAEARQTLGRCLRNKTLRQEAKLLACESYTKEGKPTAARRRLNELGKNAPLDKKLRGRVKKLYEELHGAGGKHREKKADPGTKV